MRTVFPLLAAVVLSGCISVSWPPVNGGGMAEIAPPQRHHVLLTGASQSEQLLLTQVEMLEEKLEELVANDAMRFVPAETTLAKKLVVRIRREIAGTLYSAAESDMIELRDRISIIDSSLVKVRRKREDIHT